MSATFLVTLRELNARAAAESRRTHTHVEPEHDTHESAAYLRIGDVLYVAALPVVGGAA